ncbi:MAG: von Willebrand factor type A domain-containing protein, partial [Anaerolineales bacterium]|nr:von Willebrand factor type A domain-containing protein [Anaerolineales bacterium]
MSAKKISLMLLATLIFVLSACGGAPTATETPPREEPAAAPGSKSDSGNTYAPPAPTAPVFAAGEYGDDLEVGPPSAPLSAPYRSGSEPTDMFFQDYGVNPIIDTEDDHLSTFALDVDSGSYTVMRNYLNDGNLPPADSVRVEEYVNYFEQNYALPPAHQAFGIYMDGAPSPFTQTERYDMLRVGIQGYDVSDRDRKDVSLTFVIDVSGSMDMDNRLGLVKRSLEMLVEQLGRDDRISIVVYGSDARVVLEPTPASKKGRILDAIYSLRPEGSTNAEAGLKLGYQMAMRAYNPDGVNRVILCSDGVANVGQTAADAILREVRTLYREYGFEDVESAVRDRMSKIPYPESRLEFNVFRHVCGIALKVAMESYGDCSNR